jgi:WD and tetratricopeptide repeat-containing protein 1
MAWSPGPGDFLASVSDDCTLRLWKTADFVGGNQEIEPTTSIDTDHSMNLFGVCFVEVNSSDLTLATGAMDDLVMVHKLQFPNLKVFKCHQNRVKHVISDLERENLFYSASEDGTIRRFDLREQHKCSDENAQEHDLHSCKSLLVKETSREAHESMFFSRGGGFGFKSIDINPARPYYLLASCTDSFVRLYDMRMTDSKQKPVMKYAPFHLNPDQKTSHHNLFRNKDLKSIHSTFSKFSNAGDQIAVTYNSESIYTINALEDGSKPRLLQRTSASTSQFDQAKVLALKDSAFKFLEAKKYSEAIANYSEALMYISNEKSGNSSLPQNLRSILLNNRAVCLLKRNWVGDLEIACRDLEEAIMLDEKYLKPRIRHIHALKSLKLNELAKAKASEYTRLFESESSQFSKQVLSEEKQTSQEEFIEDDCQPIHPGFSSRFCGHANVHTDIKEVCFNPSDDLILAASDDGRIYIFDSRSGKVLRALDAGTSPVNAVQPHSRLPITATSGIEHSIRIFSAFDRSKSFEAEEYDADSNAQLIRESWSPRSCQIQ